MTILEKIIVHKTQEVSETKKLFPVSFLEKQPYFNRIPNSLKKELLFTNKSGIIAEFKRKSPSKSEINLKVKIEDAVSGYESGGASGISVLTDSFFFGGKNDDLVVARDKVRVPLLRKEFIVDEYQILEAKSIGADVVLLIAAALETEKIIRFASLAKSLYLDVLLEVHSKDEINRTLNEYIDMVGVNNRNLKSFEVNIENSIRLAGLIPDGFVKISESGIEKPEDVVRLKSSGFKGFLIGEKFMKEMDPGKACRKFISQIQSDSNEVLFRKAEFSDLPAIEKLAHKIWNEVYPAIISQKQINYMLEKMYSQESLKRQINEQNHEFTLAFLTNKSSTGHKDSTLLIGYLDTRTENGIDFFLDKLYLDPEFHGKEISSRLFENVFSNKKNIKTLRLQVNRKNTRAINFYKKIGFELEYEKNFDIGDDFFMCDYVMIKKY